MLPGMSGISVLKEIRKFSNIPILCLSAKDFEFDKILGLELGADDYVTKPFSPREIVTRIQTILRRTSNMKRKHDIVFARKQILQSVWGLDYFGEERIVDTQIKRLRKKIPANAAFEIKTIYGMGYKMEAK